MMWNAAVANPRSTSFVATVVCLGVRLIFYWEAGYHWPLRCHHHNDAFSKHGIVCAAASIRGSIVVSISACHAEDPGSIPGRGDEPQRELPCLCPCTNMVA